MNFLFTFLTFALFPFLILAAPATGICSGSGTLFIQAHGAEDAVNIIKVQVNDIFHLVNQVGTNPELEVSEVSWEGFPTVQCKFIGLKGDSLLPGELGVINHRVVTFPIGPPQQISQVICSCE